MHRTARHLLTIALITGSLASGEAIASGMAPAQAVEQPACAVLPEPPESDPSAGERKRIESLPGGDQIEEAIREARDLLSSVERRAGPLSLEAARSTDLLVSLLWKQRARRWKECRAMAQRAVEIREIVLGPDHLEVAVSLNKLAQFVFRYDGAEAAIPLFERVVAVREACLGHDSPETARGLANLSMTVTVVGDYARARLLQERALSILEMTLGTNSLDVATVLNSLAITHRRLGLYEEAAELFERTIAIQTILQDKDPGAAAGTRMNLGSLYKDIGQFEKAESLYREAIRYFERKNGAENSGLPLPLCNLAAVLMDAGKLGEALTDVERAEAIRMKNGSPQDQIAAFCETIHGQILLGLGRLTESRSFLEDGLELKTRLQGAASLDVLRDQRSLIALNLGTGRFTEAFDLGIRVSKLNRENLQRVAQVLPERESLRFEAILTAGRDAALSVLTLAPSQERTAIAWDQTIRSRAIILDEVAARQRVASNTGNTRASAAAENLAQARRQLSRLWLQDDGGAEAEERLALSRKEVDRAERSLARYAAHDGFRVRESKFGMQEVSRALPSDVSLVAYVSYQRLRLDASGSAPGGIVADRTYLAFVLAAGSRIPIAVDLGDGGKIEELVRTWRREVSNPGLGLPLAGSPAEERTRAAGRDLRQAIWDPVVRFVGRPRMILVVPDGALNFVSLAALPDEGSGYLAESPILLHYLSSERDVAILNEHTARGEGLLAIGGPDFDSRPGEALMAESDGVAARTRPLGYGMAPGYTGSRAAPSPCAAVSALHFAPLGASSLEVDEVSDILGASLPRRSGGRPETLRLKGAEATEGSFKELAPGRRILHLSTHAYFLERPCESSEGMGGLLSGLALAGANRGSETPLDRDDGILTAEEIGSLDLSSVDWVVLSACETGLGTVADGEGVLGLRRAFKVAGARTMIMSLWRVEDERSRSWMRSLYVSRASRASTPGAIREAEVSALSHLRAQGLTTHPYYWGGFVAEGDWK